MLPAVSSVTLARARLGWSAESVRRGHAWSAATSTSCGASSRPAAGCSCSRRTARLPATVADRLVDAGFGDSALTVLVQPRRRRRSAASTSGPPTGRGQGARRSTSSASSAARTAIAEARRRSPRSPGCPTTPFEHDGQITKRDLRALGPVPAGARARASCSGTSAPAPAPSPSSGCAATRGAEAVAVERDDSPDRDDPAQRARLGVPALQTVHRPGARGARRAAHTRRHLRRRWSHRPGHARAVLAPPSRPAGRLVVHAVTLETETVVLQHQRRLGGELTRISVETADRWAASPAGRRHVRSCSGRSPSPSTIWTPHDRPLRRRRPWRRRPAHPARCLDCSPRPTWCVYAGTYVDDEVLAHCSSSAPAGRHPGPRPRRRSPRRSSPRTRAGSTSYGCAPATRRSTPRIDRADPSPRRRRGAWDITPGVPAYAAAAAILGSELTVPELVQTVVLHPDPEPAPRRCPPPRRWPRLRPSQGSLVLHLGITRIRRAGRRADFVVRRRLPGGGRGLRHASRTRWSSAAPSPTSPTRSSRSGSAHRADHRLACARRAVAPTDVRRRVAPLRQGQGPQSLNPVGSMSPGDTDPTHFVVHRLLSPPGEPIARRRRSSAWMSCSTSKPAWCHARRLSSGE